MNYLGLGSIIIVAIIIFVVYSFARKSDIYANDIEISVCKLFNVKIRNKLKNSGRVAKPPEHL